MIVSIDETRKNHVSGQVHSPNLRHSAPGTIGGWSVAESPIYNRELGGEGGGCSCCHACPGEPPSGHCGRMPHGVRSAFQEHRSHSFIHSFPVCPNRGETGELRWQGRGNSVYIREPFRLPGKRGAQAPPNGVPPGRQDVNLKSRRSERCPQ